MAMRIRRPGIGTIEIYNNQIEIEKNYYLEYFTLLQFHFRNVWTKFVVFDVAKSESRILL